MPDLTAKRTLVKSPPELWEELSEVDRLAAHFEAFGEITITKLEPEHTVAWEGEHASGTVSIEPSGWGTKVTFTAAVKEDEPEPEPEPDPEPDPEPEPEPDPLPVEAPEAATTNEPAVDEPVLEEPAPVPDQPEPRRRGFWARLLGRRTMPQPAPETATRTEPKPVLAEPGPALTEPEPVLPEPALTGPEPVPREPEAALAEAEPLPGSEIAGHEPDEAESPEGEDAPVPSAAERAQAVLEGALDALGSAHHRPFSRG
jgi:hypothetical protein